MKHMDDRGPANQHEDAFRLIEAALSPHAAVRRSHGESGADIVVQLADGPTLRLACKRWPRDAEDGGTASGVVWVLSNATRTLRDRLRREGRSFVDLRGRLFLSFPGLLVDRTDVRLPPRRGRVTRPFDPFADRSSLVIRALWEDRAEPGAGVRALAERAGVAPATVTRTVRELERHGVLRVQRVGRASRIRLVDHRALFLLWTGRYDWTKNQSLGVAAPIGDPLRFLRRSGDVFGRRKWSLTLHAGASLVAPHAAWERIHAYVDVDEPDELSAIAERAGWPAGDEGRLVLIKPFYRDSVWHGMRDVEGLPVASDLQLALDLWNYPLRGREQAEHLISARNLFG